MTGGTERADVEIQEVTPDAIERLNAMCVAPNSDPGDVMKESTKAHERAAALGAKVFGAFLDGKPVGRVEVMPIEAAPLPLEGESLWVIRCLWVLPEAEGAGIARTLMELALDASRGSRGVAVVTYPDWMPVPFFERFGFKVAAQSGPATVMLRKADDQVQIAFAPTMRDFGDSDGAVRVEAVVSGRCPWMIQHYRKLLGFARTLSDKVIATERMIGTRTDAIRFGEENLYIDGTPPFEGPVRLAEFEKVIRARLAAKGLA